jgi:hypothetical protein
MCRTMWLSKRRSWGLLLLVCRVRVKEMGRLIVVPIWIALSSTVILYNSKSAGGFEES